MKIVMVGAGNLATHLSKALLSSGNNILQVYSRTEEAAYKLAKVLGCDAVTEINGITDNADLYIVALKDSVLECVLPRLCCGKRNAMFVHTAGSMPMSVFEGLAKHYGVLYPMQTFSKSATVNFKEIPCFIEASDSQTLQAVRSLCEGITQTVLTMPGEQRMFVHLAAVFACNFTNHCYDVAYRILQEHGIDFNVMLPLIRETAFKMERMSPSEAQTGPAVRFDKNIINKHIGLLGNYKMWQKMYEIMSLGIYELKQ